MTTKEKKLAADLLRIAADEFSNHGCNDIDENLFAGWTDEEKTKLSMDYYSIYGDPDDAGNEIKEDWIAMMILAHKLSPEE